MDAAKILAAFVLVAVLTGTSLANKYAGKDAAAEVKNIPDHCHGLVDPYIPSQEKSRFFAAAGADSELSAAEFAKNAKLSDKIFCRKFDSFKDMLRFDADGNGSIDWMEAEKYRLDLRKRVLNAFDADKNGKLTGKEREKANRALESGKIPRGKRRTVFDRLWGRKKAESPASKEMFDKHDTNGDGVLDEDEIKAMAKARGEQRRKQMLDKYDLDGDGKLSREERMAMRRDYGGAWKDMIDEWALKHFDADGDGKLNAEENAEVKAFGKRFKELGKEMQLLSSDFDGDGQISEDEKKRARMEWTIVGMKMMFKGKKLMDANGDGKVTRAETRQFQQKVAGGFKSWFNEFEKDYDRDGDGRLNREERDSLASGYRDEMIRRMKKYDKNKDGRTSAFELEKMLYDFGREIKVLPEDDR